MKIIKKRLKKRLNEPKPKTIPLINVINTITTPRVSDKRDIQYNYFSYFSMKTYVVGMHKKCLHEVLVMSTHNTSFCAKIRKSIIFFFCGVWKNAFSRALSALVKIFCFCSFFQPNILMFFLSLQENMLWVFSGIFEHHRGNCEWVPKHMFLGEKGKSASYPELL